MPGSEVKDGTDDEGRPGGASRYRWAGHGALKDLTGFFDRGSVDEFTEATANRGEAALHC
jgi:hypothetical protein